MTLVFDSKTTRPGTHALIVASGDVPHYPGANTGTSISTGLEVASWLIERFRNPDAELATIEFLASSPGERVRYQPPDAFTSFILDPPRYASFSSALESWRKRLDSDSANIALFYYVGRIFRTGETLMPLQDFGDGSAKSRDGVFLSVLLAAMAGCRAERQLYIVDGAHLEAGSKVIDLRPRSLRMPPRRNSVSQNVIVGETPPSQDGASTLLSQALMRILGGSLGYGPVSVSALVIGLKSETHVVESRVMGDFNLGYLYDPRLPQVPIAAESATGAPEIAMADGRASAPAPARKARAPRPKSAAKAPESKKPVARTRPGTARVVPPAAEQSRRADDEIESDFVPDDAEDDRDELGRAGLAIALARRLHKIWWTANDPRAPVRADSRAAFVVHVDAPWGGGKTTFANFVGRILNPLPGGAGPPAQFLRQRFPGADVGGIFLRDPSVDDAAARTLAGLPPDRRRPWVVVNFNAWQAEHIAPPWWVFYQAIRKGCFDAVLAEGDGAWRPRPLLPHDAPARLRWGRAVARAVDRARSRAGGLFRWVHLWAVEYLWRLFNPKIRVLLATAAVSLALLWVLAGTGVWGIIQSGQGTGAGYIFGNPVGLFLTGLSGVTGLWALGALFTESIVPGTDTLAERLSLGGGDPFARFRRHFARTMTRVRRPVMVLVDDLDRCRPDFVVDLVRGIQTLLRSPRVVFVILGDRDWIERAFEAHHQAMRAVDVGPEQSFGARFVEKAIQMSFILPALGEKTQHGYVRRVLLGDRAAGAAEPPMSKEVAAGLNEVLDRAVAEPRIDPIVSEELLQKVVDDVAKLPGAGTQAPPMARPELAQMLHERLAGQVAIDEKVEEDVVHQLEKLSAYFPANPRQIKRIANAFTLCYAAAVALQREGLVPNAAFRSQLALWVIIMTEWPETWRLLASFPDLADILTAKNRQEAMKRPGVTLPGSLAATDKALDRIISDPDLMALLAGGSGSQAALESRYVRVLAELTPLHSRKRRLAEEAGASPRRAVARAKVPARAAKPKGAKGKPARD